MKGHKHPPHWYKKYIGECPVCGSNKSFKERIYGEKPEKLEDRIEHLPDTYTYDYCLE